MSFYIWVSAAIVLYSGSFIYSMYKLFCNNNSETNRSRRLSIIQRLIGYPIIIIVCWSPSFVIDLSQNQLFIYSNYVSLVLFTCLPALQGFMTGFLFFILFLRQYIENPQKYKIESPLRLFSSYLSSIIRVSPIMTHVRQYNEDVTQNISHSTIIL